MVYKQTTPMQWVTFYYYGNDVDKIIQAREKNLQMKKKIRYADVLDEIRVERLETLSDMEKHFVGLTSSGLIVMFENNK